MPEGTKVDKMYKAMRRKGMPKGKAARIAQSKSGEALATGKPPKHGAAMSLEDQIRRGMEEVDYKL